MLSVKKKLKKSIVNIFPKKTSNLSYPKINQELDRHFIRGFMDGDGSFYYKRDVLVFSLVGTKSILESIQQILHKELDIVPTKLIKHVTEVYYLRIGHKNTLKLREWIYNNCSIAMERKKNYKDRIK